MRGFTLIECIITLCIITLILSLVMPGFSKDNTLENTKRQVCIQVGETRLEAIESGETVEYIPCEIEENVEVQVEPPLYFYPNGRCSNGMITISYEEEQVILKARSITGDLQEYEQADRGDGLP